MESVPDSERRSDTGEAITLHDVVGGRWPELVAPLRQLHDAAFPTHAFAGLQIERDARRASQRPGVIVHQWLLCIDGQPVGYSLSDSNLARRTAPIHFLAVDPEVRHLTVDGARLGTWFLHDALRQLDDDLGPENFGALAETPDYKLRPFLATGWQPLPVDYAEPVHGWDWPREGLEMRPLVLLWLPPRHRRVPLDPREVVSPAVATFALDMYRLPIDHPLIVASVDTPDRRVDAVDRWDGRSEE